LLEITIQPEVSGFARSFFFDLYEPLQNRDLNEMSMVKVADSGPFRYLK